MTKIIVRHTSIILGLLSVITISFIHYAPGLKEDEKAIIQVIERDSQSFWDKDFQSYADCWAHKNYVRTMGWWAAGGITVVEGWEERGSRTKKHMDENPETNPQNPVRENMNIRIGQDMAWVTFDQYGKDTKDPTFDMPGLSRETRYLRKSTVSGKSFM